jgi:hypothetical protein
MYVLSVAEVGKNDFALQYLAGIASIACLCTNHEDAGSIPRLGLD